MAELLWRDENDYLAVQLFADATAEITDRATGGQWRMGPVAPQDETPIDIGHVWTRTERTPPETYPGRFVGAIQGDHIRFTLLGRLRQPVGQFTVVARLDGPWWVVEISDIDDSIPSLVYPPPVTCDSLVLPMNVGRWIREPLSGQHFWPYPVRLNMRWFGGLKGEHGWIAVLEDGHTDAGTMAKEMSAAPAWLQTLGQWTPRSVRYRFVKGGYVELAKTYREYAMAHGLFRSLAEKMVASPAVRNLHGGHLLSIMQGRTVRPERFEDRLQPLPDPPETNPVVEVSHQAAAAIIRHAQEMDMERALVVVRGWIQGGYDESHPDIWPPDPSFGTLEQLKALVTTGDPVTVALHDNYNDIYPQTGSFPDGVIQRPDGKLMTGGIWAGGQTYIVNARNALEYARRNWEAIRTLEPRAMFIDVTTATYLYDSYEDGNTLTRAQDEALKIELLQFYKGQGMVLGSEEGADFGVPYLDWIENRHRRVAGESIPLWPLVYHDAAFCARYEAASGGGAQTTLRWLTDMLWGYMPLWGVRSLSQWEERKTAFSRTLPVRNWHARVGVDEMVSHDYLDRQIERTVFSSGAAIVANFSPQTHQIAGLTVPAQGYVIQD